MVSRDAILLPAGTGDLIVRSARDQARRAANLRRLRGRQPDDFLEGLLLGHTIVASVYLGAGKDFAMAAENEIRFLLDGYLAMPRGVCV